MIQVSTSLVLIVVGAAMCLPSMEGVEPASYATGYRYFRSDDLQAKEVMETETGLEQNRTSKSALDYARCWQYGDCQPTTTAPPPPQSTTTPPTCGSTPPSTYFPSLPSMTLTTNCDFCDHDLQTLTCVPTAFDCAMKCAANWMCTHFTYIANLKGGTCKLKSAPKSGGAWATPVPAPSPLVCGYIPKRCFTSLQLNLCLGLDIFGGSHWKK